MSPSAQREAGGGRPSTILLTLILGFLTALGPMSVDMYLPGLPELARDMHSGQGEAALTVAIFFFGMAVGQLVYGPLSDRMGRRGPLLAGLGLYVIGTIGCAIAPSIPVLMATRLLQAIGACSGAVIARAIVRDHFEARESARMFSRLILIMGVSPIFAPLFGGFVLMFGTWRTVFWLLTGVGAVLLTSVLFLLPESRSEETAAQAARENVLASFRAVFRLRDVVGFLFAGAFNSGALTVYVASSAAVIISVYGIPPQAFGWVFGSNGIGLITASQINARLVRRHHPATILRWATKAALAVAAILFIDALTGFGGVWGILVPLFALLTTLGFNMPNAMAGALARDPARAGATSALIGTGQFGVGTLGATVASLLYDHSARPMAGTILFLILIGTTVFHLMVPKGHSS